MAVRKCVVCPRTFEAKRPHAKYCGQTCKKRAQRLPVNVTPITARATASQNIDQEDLVAAVKAELAAAGCDGSSLGALAMSVARRMTNQFDTGSAFAALSKELRLVMAQAMASATPAADPLDELRARRDRKRRGAHG
jgi:hypothetical protein